MLAVPGLVDAFCEASDDSQQNFATNECPTNSYTPMSLIKKKFQGKRIDYIMFHPGTKVSVKLAKYWLPMPSRVPSYNFSYSDHEAIASNLLIESNQQPIKYTNNEIRKLVLQECIDVCNEALDDLIMHRRIYGFSTCVLLIFLVIIFATDAPFGFTIFYHFLKVAVSGCIFFTSLMASVWNNIEKHGILSAKLAMEVKLALLKERS